jgi:hypothetical protein
LSSIGFDFVDCLFLQQQDGKLCLPRSPEDAIPKVVVRRFGAHEIAPQGQEVESISTS